jgi:hypothetical protein
MFVATINIANQGKVNKNGELPVVLTLMRGKAPRQVNFLDGTVARGMFNAQGLSDSEFAEKLKGLHIFDFTVTDTEKKYVDLSYAGEATETTVAVLGVEKGKSVLYKDNAKESTEHEAGQIAATIAAGTAAVAGTQSAF